MGISFGVVLTALVLATTPIAPLASPVPITPGSTPSEPSPSPSPTQPSNAQLNISNPLVPVNGKLTIQGTNFLPNQRVTLLVDGAKDKPLVTPMADSQGRFTVDTQVPDYIHPAGTDSETHRICVLEAPTTCALISVQPMTSPSPTSVPSPTPTPAPSPSTSPAASGGPSDSSGLGVLLRPPFVFFPILLILGAGGTLAYWLHNRRRRPTRYGATVTHHSARANQPPSSLPPRAGPAPDLPLSPPADSPWAPPPPRTATADWPPLPPSQPREQWPHPPQSTDDEPPDLPIPSD